MFQNVSLHISVLLCVALYTNGVWPALETISLDESGKQTPTVLKEKRIGTTLKRDPDWPRHH